MPRVLLMHSLLLLAVAAATPSLATPVTYTFEGLTSGSDLVGQDGWVDLGSGAFIDVVTGSGSNPSLVAANPGGSGTHWAERTNDVVFSFPGFTGNEASAYLQTDFQFASGTNFHFYVGNTSPWIQLLDDVGTITSPSFGVRGANFGSQSSTLVPAGINTGDWLRIRLVMDLSANGGAGFGDVFFQNLTQGDTSFTAVGGLQDVDLEMGGVDATTWNSIAIRTDSSASASRIDNLTVMLPWNEQKLTEQKRTCAI